MWWVIGKLGSLAYNGLGGVDASNIEVALRMYGVPEEDRGWLFEKIVKFCSERLKKKSDGEEHDTIRNQG